MVTETRRLFVGQYPHEPFEWLFVWCDCSCVYKYVFVVGLAAQQVGTAHTGDAATQSSCGAADSSAVSVSAGPR